MLSLHCNLLLSSWFACVGLAILVASGDLPNILFMIVDDLGWTDISHNGAEYSTPNIDSIYKNGIELTNYYVNFDCSPTRTAILTGKYAWKSGLQSIHTVLPATTEHIPFNTPTVSELLQYSGYDTYAIGKWHVGYAAWNMTPTGRGFNQHFGMFQGAQFYYNHTTQPVGGEAAQKVTTGYDFFENTNVYYDAIGNYSNLLYRNKTMDVLKQYGIWFDEQNPFFIYLAFQTVHEPVEPAPKSYDTCVDNKYNTEYGGMREIYCNKILYLDESIGMIIDELKELNIYNNTLIVLTTDNGGMPYWGNGGALLSYGCNWPYRAGKATLFEGGLKGIGVISNEYLIPTNLLDTSSNILTHCTDWLMTLVEGIAQQNVTYLMNKYLNYTMESGFDSLNIWNYLLDSGSNENDIEWDRKVLYANIDLATNFSSNNDTLSTVIVNDTEYNTVWKYIEGTQLYTDYFYCNQTTWNNIGSNATESKWLFNLSSNPFEYESENLIKKYPNIALKLKNMILDQIENGGFREDQNATRNVEGYPVFHDGVWLPWL